MKHPVFDEFLKDQEIWFKALIQFFGGSGAKFFLCETNFLLAKIDTSQRWYFSSQRKFSAAWCPLPLLYFLRSLPSNQFTLRRKPYLTSGKVVDYKSKYDHAKAISSLTGSPFSSKKLYWFLKLFKLGRLSSLNILWNIKYFTQFNLTCWIECFMMYREIFCWDLREKR